MTMAARKAWRDAATVILTAKNGRHVTPNTFDYSVLMLKRSSKSKFMPNAYVFPGGVLSSADMSRVGTNSSLSTPRNIEW